MTGFIYFIRGGEFVKIGFSKNPKNRLSQFATISPFKLTIVAMHPGTREDEAALHKWLGDHHCHGEWFRWHHDVEQIAQFGLPHFDRPPPRPLHSPSPRRPPHTGIDSIVEALGGSTATATILGVGPSAISNWKTRGSIPSRKFMLLERALADRGKGKPSPDLFGFKIPAAPRKS